jgi:TetR/AcrR family fatty acid metabolism transcriptional regulator
MSASSVEEIHAAARRAQIIQAAQQVFAEKGYHRATTKAIAQAAGVAEGTIYLYFKTKADLLIALIEEFTQIDHRTQRHAEGMQYSLEEYYQQRLVEKGNQLAPYFDLLQAILPEMLADPQLRQRYSDTVIQPGIRGLEEYLTARAENGEFPPERAAYMARVLSGGLLGLEILYILGDPLTREIWTHPQEHANSLVHLLFAGLHLPETEAPINPAGPITQAGPINRTGPEDDAKPSGD